MCEQRTQRCGGPENAYWLRSRVAHLSENRTPPPASTALRSATHSHRTGAELLDAPADHLRKRRLGHPIRRRMHREDAHPAAVREHHPLQDVRARTRDRSPDARRHACLAPRAPMVVPLVRKIRSVRAGFIRGEPRILESERTHGRDVLDAGDRIRVHADSAGSIRDMPRHWRPDDERLERELVRNSRDRARL